MPFSCSTNIDFLFCYPFDSGILFVIICKSINNANYYCPRIEKKQILDKLPANIETILNFGQFRCQRSDVIYNYSRFY